MAPVAAAAGQPGLPSSVAVEQGSKTLLDARRHSTGILAESAGHASSNNAHLLIMPATSEAYSAIAEVLCHSYAAAALSLQKFCVIATLLPLLSLQKFLCHCCASANSGCTSGTPGEQ
jgi:hypothetical protein